MLRPHMYYNSHYNGCLQGLFSPSAASTILGGLLIQASYTFWLHGLFNFDPKPVISRLIVKRLKAYLHLKKLCNVDKLSESAIRAMLKMNMEQNKIEAMVVIFAPSLCANLQSLRW